MIYEEVINAEKRLDDCIDWTTGEVSEDYDEYKKLAQTSSDMKLKLSNPEMGVEVR